MMMYHIHVHLMLAVAALFLSSIVIEAIVFRNIGRTYAWREALASLAVSILQRIATLLSTLVLLPILSWVWQHRVYTLYTAPALQMVLAFLAVEFAYYWMHRASHSIRWMWATHSVHHSAEQLNLTAAVRLGATGFISLEWLPFVPLIFFGISPETIIILLGINLLYQFFLHSELIPKLGPLEWILNTPRHHRVHHASNRAYLDKNFGGMTIVFDRLFGTFSTERSDEILVYGLRGEHRGLNPFTILFAGWKPIVRSVFSAVQRLYRVGWQLVASGRVA